MVHLDDRVALGSHTLSMPIAATAPAAPRQRSRRRHCTQGTATVSTSPTLLQFTLVRSKNNITAIHAVADCAGDDLLRSLCRDRAPAALKKSVLHAGIRGQRQRWQTRCVGAALPNHAATTCVHGPGALEPLCSHGMGHLYFYKPCSGYGAACCCLLPVASGLGTLLHTSQGVSGNTLPVLP